MEVRNRVGGWWELLQGRSTGLERGALVPGVALPCVTQDRFTCWGASSSVTEGAWADSPRSPSQLLSPERTFLCVHQGLCSVSSSL